MLFFGPEFIGRVEDIVPKISSQMLLFFVGDTCPSFAEDYHRATANCSSAAPRCWWTTRTTRPSTTPPAPPASPRPSCCGTSACSSLPGWRPSTTRPSTRTCSCASRPVPHGGQDALVRLAVHRKPSGAAEGQLPQAIFDAVSGEKCTIVWLLVPWCQDILAALDRGDLKIENYQLSQWRAHAHRRPAGAPLPHPPLDEVPSPTTSTTPTTGSPSPPARGASIWDGPHPQGGGHRRARLRLEGENRGRERRPRGVRGGGRAVRPGPRRHDLLLPRPGGHRRGAQGRLAPHRGHG